ncbi:MAG: lysozyme [Bacteroidales bacterium]|nr:lysozyme [Bacteroidales bacterium]
MSAETWINSASSSAFPLTGKPTSKRRVDEIIVHYTATPQGENFTVEQIRQMHLANGWSDIGYHWYIDANGKVFKGRPEDYAGAHTVGHNTRSIGVCYCGGCPPRSNPNWQNVGLDTRTPAQKESLRSIIRELKRKYPAASVHGHREFASKPCPGFDAKSEYANL